MSFTNFINLIHTWLLFLFVSGTHFYWCLLGQVCGQPRLKAGLQNRNLLAKLCWALYWHNLSHYQPLHSDGAERWTLITEHISPTDCLISQKQFMLMEEDLKMWDMVSATCQFLDYLKQEIFVSLCGNNAFIPVSVTPSCVKLNAE